MFDNFDTQIQCEEYYWQEEDFSLNELDERS